MAMTHFAANARASFAAPHAAIGAPDFYRLVAEVATRFANTPAEQVDSAIVDTMEALCDALDADACVLLVPDEDAGARATHYWVRSGCATPRCDVEDLASVTDADLEDPVDCELFCSLGARSTASFALHVRGARRGVIVFCAMRAARTWADDELSGLRLAVAVIGQALAREDDREDLTRTVRETREVQDQLRDENVVLRREVKSLKSPHLVVGESAAIRRVLAQVDQVAPTTATVLLLGETGSGKEVIAQHIHNTSPRRHRPMVRVSCAAIPGALIESELFGRERGAYTGALSRQIGRFELANGSTIFLDEIGELPPEVQVKLLRVLQDHTIERLGSAQSIKVDVRVIAATNRDLEKMIANNTFREDLYYRLNVFPITVPPLRQHQDDVPALVWTFVDEFSKAFGKHIESISKESMAALQRYAWPGNVRELRNAVEREMIVSTGPNLVIPVPRQSAAPGRRTGTRLIDVETEHIRSILDSTGWRVRGAGGAAERLGIKPTTLESRMAKLGIVRDKSRQPLQAIS